MFEPLKKVRIGIPRTLFYYSYYPFCDRFFTYLGAEVLVSQKTTKSTVEIGLNASSNELCIPIKILYGHILDLKERVDYIFLPYVISSIKGTYYCPKIIGSPDIIKATMPDVNLLSFDLDMDNFYSSLFSSLSEVARKLSLNPLKIYAAYKEAYAHQVKFNSIINQGYLFEEALRMIDGPDFPQPSASDAKKLKIAVIGHPYVINDAHISFDMIRKLKMREIQVVTSDRLTDDEVSESIKHIEYKPHWSLGSRVLGSAIYFSKDDSVDGMIYLTPFSCASDSLIKEYMDANVQIHKPIMTITVDEHSSDAGVITRIEAFIDMIDRRKNISAQEQATLSVSEMLSEMLED